MITWAIERNVLIATGAFAALATIISVFLISKHQQYMKRLDIQPKIVGILWMVPIYAIDSWIILVSPANALYIAMLRDCYEVSYPPNLIFVVYLTMECFAVRVSFGCILIC